VEIGSVVLVVAVDLVDDNQPFFCLTPLSCHVDKWGCDGHGLGKSVGDNVDLVVYVVEKGRAGPAPCFLDGDGVVFG